MSHWPPNMRAHQPGNTPTWEDRMTTLPHHTAPVVEVGVMNAAEWKAAVQRALADLKLTYDELADMAKRRDFISTEAQKLWVAIGGKRP